MFWRPFRNLLVMGCVKTDDPSINLWCTLTKEIDKPPVFRWYM